VDRDEDAAAIHLALNFASELVDRFVARSLVMPLGFEKVVFTLELHWAVDLLPLYAKRLGHFETGKLGQAKQYSLQRVAPSLRVIGCGIKRQELCAQFLDVEFRALLCGLVGSASFSCLLDLAVTDLLELP
jgi:hypothetical protein